MSDRERSSSPSRRAAIRTLRHWAPYLLTAGTLFVGSTVVGAAVGAERDTPLLPAASDANPYAGLDAIGLFLHNGRVGAFLIAGALLFGLPTAYLLVLNGFLFGAGLVEFADAYGPLATVAMVSPHGAVEILALLLAGAISFRWCHGGWRVASGTQPDTTAPRFLLENALALVLVVGMLAVAAFVEATISAWIGGVLT